MPLTDATFRAGFKSIRQFNQVRRLANLQKGNPRQLPC